MSSSREAVKSKLKSSLSTPPRRDPVIHQGETDAESYKNLAKFIISPEMASLRVVRAAEGEKQLGEQIDTPALIETLRAQSEAIQKGDLSMAEDMLANQAIALQTLFARLTERAMTSEYMRHLEPYLKLALKAQSQCRATIETLSAIKNPPVIYAKQANIAQGHQQVNNGAVEPSRRRENKKAQNQLSGS